MPHARASGCAKTSQPWLADSDGPRGTLRAQRPDDAIHATQAALGEGIVAGGGVVYLRCVPALEAAAKADGDMRAVLLVRARALEVPTRLIAKNCDVDDGVVVERTRAGDDGWGFDAASTSYGDMFASGIIDPAKVVRVALENAVSVASTPLLMEATMTDVRSRPPSSSAPRQRRSYEIQMRRSRRSVSLSSRAPVGQACSVQMFRA